MENKQIRVIDTLTTKELIDEVMNRCSPAIFLGTRQEDCGVPVNLWHWKGSEAHCYALCHQLSFYINRDMVYFETKDAMESE